jgi:4,5-epoxidase
MNTGIGDAENLAWKLALVVNATADVALLDSYEAERRPIAASVLRSTGAAGNVILGHHLFARLLRDRIFIPLMNTAAMQRRVWEGVSQLKVTYRDGPLGRHARFWHNAPLPGDRVPDFACVRADGGATTLHAELGDKWALVVPGDVVRDEYAAVAAQRLGEDAVVALAAAGAEIMLVRPDAHLGWRGRGDPGALDRWLTALTRDGRAR